MDSEMRELRRDELSFRQWEAQRAIREKAATLAVSLTEQERYQFGGAIEAAKAIAEYIRNG